MAKIQKQKKKKVSCLGALLIFCMLLIAASTLTVNLLFRGNRAPRILGKRYCYYTAEDMGDRIPAGEVVIAEETDLIRTQDIVLYRTEDEQYRIAVASLIVETSSTVPEQSSSVYYLTTVTNTTALEVEAENIVGVCKQRSPQLGVLVGFLTGTAGIIVGLVLPCLILLLYLIGLLISNREAAADMMADDEEPDLAFVKSIQKKQQAIAERDAERLAQTQDVPGDDRAQRRLTDEEVARMEEEEAARRAERIAAVRSHMESRRQTETPDGVPLYTTEIITKTHTLSIPKVGDKPLTTTQTPLQPTPTGSIPRLTATGHIQIPTEEQLAQEQQQDERMRKAQELARAAQNAAFAAKEQQEMTAKPEPAAAELEVPAQEAPVPEVHAEETPAAEIPQAEAPAPIAEPEAQPVPEQPAAPVAEAAPAPAPAPKQRIASASFNDLMAFLNDEQKKLK